MDDARFVCGFDGFRNLIGYEKGLIDWNTAFGDPICQRRAVNQFHDQRGDTVRLLETVDVRDVGMIQ
jgi:hypothetical protein